MKSSPSATKIRLKPDNHGFTLIETLVAVAIFSIGILAVGSMQLSAINNNASARMRTEATILASEKIEELMSLEDYNNPLLGTDTQSAASANNIYCLEWSAIVDTPILNTKTITLSVRWTDGDTGCGNFDQKENEVNIDFIRANI
jgi:prepilin-type N-terminal cleavage/methylation domain-containing protein